MRAVGLGRLVFIPVIVFALGCAHTAALDRSGRSGSPADVAIEDVPVHGFDARIYLEDGAMLDGELLDVAKEWVAIETAHTDFRVPVSQIREIRVTAYSNGILVGGLIAWTTTGTALTLSHGVFLLFTAPLWILSGVSATVSAAIDSDQSALVKGGEQTKLWQFVRFPQGLPPGFHLEDHLAHP